MSSRSRNALTVGFVAAMLTGACSVRDVEPFSGGWEVDEQALQAWAPPYATPAAAPGLLWTGRLWAAPNPILAPLHAGEIGACGGAYLSNIGTEPVSILSVRWEGDALLETPWYDWTFPLTLNGFGGQGGGIGGVGFSVCLDAIGGAVEGGVLIFETDDLATPELRVEVQAAPGMTDPGYDQIRQEYHARLDLSPDPVRFVHAAGQTEIDVVATRRGEEPLNLRGLGTLGPDVSVVSVLIEGQSGWDGQYPVAIEEDATNVYIRLRYAPQSVVPRDDALIIAFDDGDSESYRLVVPVLVK